MTYDPGASLPGYQSQEDMQDDQSLYLQQLDQTANEGASMYRLTYRFKNLSRMFPELDESQRLELAASEMSDEEMTKQVMQIVDLKKVRDSVEEFKKLSVPDQAYQWATMDESRQAMLRANGYTSPEEEWAKQTAVPEEWWKQGLSVAGKLVTAPVADPGILLDSVRGAAGDQDAARRFESKVFGHRGDYAKPEDTDNWWDSAIAPLGKGVGTVVQTGEAAANKLGIGSGVKAGLAFLGKANDLTAQQVPRMLEAMGGDQMLAQRDVQFSYAIERLNRQGVKLSPDQQRYLKWRFTQEYPATYVQGANVGAVSPPNVLMNVGTALTGLGGNQVTPNPYEGLPKQTVDDATYKAFHDAAFQLAEEKPEFQWGWKAAFDQVYDGERYILPSVQVEAGNLLGDADPAALPLATAIARGDSFETYLEKELKVDPNTEDGKRQAEELKKKYLGDKNFTKAVDLMSSMKAKATFGRSTAETLAIPETSPVYSGVSGSVDALAALSLDPTLAVGRLGKSARALTRGIDAANYGEDVNRMQALARSVRERTFGSHTLDTFDFRTVRPDIEQIGSNPALQKRLRPALEAQGVQIQGRAGAYGISLFDADGLATPLLRENYDVIVKQLDSLIVNGDEIASTAIKDAAARASDVPQLVAAGKEALEARIAAQELRSAINEAGIVRGLKRPGILHPIDAARARAAASTDRAFQKIADSFVALADEGPEALAKLERELPYSIDAIDGLLRHHTISRSIGGRGIETADDVWDFVKGQTGQLNIRSGRGWGNHITPNIIELPRLSKGREALRSATSYAGRQIDWWATAAEADVRVGGKITGKLKNMVGTPLSAAIHQVPVENVLPLTGAESAPAARNLMNMGHMVGMSPVEVDQWYGRFLAGHTDQNAVLGLTTDLRSKLAAQVVGVNPDPLVERVDDVLRGLTTDEISDFATTRGALDSLDDLGDQVYGADRWSQAKRNAFTPVSNVADRMEVARRFIKEVIDRAGVNLDDEAAEVLRRQVETMNVAYGPGITDEMMSLSGDIYRAGLFPDTQHAVNMATPDWTMIAAQSNRIGVIRSMFNGINNEWVNAFMNTVWKPWMLLRAGFIARAAGEEMLAMMSRLSLEGIEGVMSSRVLRRSPGLTAKWSHLPERMFGNLHKTAPDLDAFDVSTMLKHHSWREHMKATVAHGASLGLSVNPNSFDRLRMWSDWHAARTARWMKRQQFQLLRPESQIAVWGGLAASGGKGNGWVEALGLDELTPADLMRSATRAMHYGPAADSYAQVAAAQHGLASPEEMRGTDPVIIRFAGDSKFAPEIELQLAPGSFEKVERTSAADLPPELSARYYDATGYHFHDRLTTRVATSEAVGLHVAVGAEDRATLATQLAPTSFHREVMPPSSIGTSRLPPGTYVQTTFDETGTSVATMDIEQIRAVTEGAAEADNIDELQGLAPELFVMHPSGETALPDADRVLSFDKDDWVTYIATREQQRVALGYRSDEVMPPDHEAELAMRSLEAVAQRKGVALETLYESEERVQPLMRLDEFADPWEGRAPGDWAPSPNFDPAVDPETGLPTRTAHGPSTIPAGKQSVYVRPDDPRVMDPDEEAFWTPDEVRQTRRWTRKDAAARLHDVEGEILRRLDAVGGLPILLVPKGSPMYQEVRELVTALGGPNARIGGQRVVRRRRPDELIGHETAEDAIQGLSAWRHEHYDEFLELLNERSQLLSAAKGRVGDDMSDATGVFEEVNNYRAPSIFEGEAADAAYNYPVFEDLGVADLKRIAREHGLSTTGKKSDLVERLVGSVGAAPTTPPVRVTGRPGRLAGVQNQNFDQLRLEVADLETTVASWSKEQRAFMHDVLEGRLMAVQNTPEVVEQSDLLALAFDKDPALHNLAVALTGADHADPLRKLVVDMLEDYVPKPGAKVQRTWKNWRIPDETRKNIEALSVMVPRQMKGPGKAILDETPLKWFDAEQMHRAWVDEFVRQVQSPEAPPQVREMRRSGGTSQGARALVPPRGDHLTWYPLMVDQPTIDHLGEILRSPNPNDVDRMVAGLASEHDREVLRHMLLSFDSREQSSIASAADRAGRQLRPFTTFVVADYDQAVRILDHLRNVSGVAGSKAVGVTRIPKPGALARQGLDERTGAAVSTYLVRETPKTEELGVWRMAAPAAIRAEPLSPSPLRLNDLGDLDPQGTHVVDGVTPDEVARDWGEATWAYMESMFMSRGQPLTEVLNPGYKGTLDHEVIAHVDPARLPMELVLPMLYTPPGPFRSWYDKVLRYGFDHVIGGAISAIVRHPLYQAAYAKALKATDGLVEMMANPVLTERARAVAQARGAIKYAPDWARQAGDGELEALRDWWTGLNPVTRSRIHSTEDFRRVAYTDARERMVDEIEAAAVYDPTSEYRLDFWGRVAGEHGVTVRQLKKEHFANSREAGPGWQNAWNTYFEDVNDAMPSWMQNKIDRGDYSVMRFGLDDDESKALLDWLHHDERIQTTVGQAAAQRAVAESVPYIDDHNIRSFAQTYIRNLVPFQFAQEQFLKRWARTLVYAPEALQRANLLIHGFLSSSFIEERNGEKQFVIPFSDVATKAFARAPIISNIWGGSVEMIEAPKLSMNPSSMLPGIPSDLTTPASPSIIGALPVRYLANQFPEFNRAVEGWTPEHLRERGIVDQVMPSWAAKIFHAATQDPEGLKAINDSAMDALHLMEAERIRLEGLVIEAEEDGNLEEAESLRARVNQLKLPENATEEDMQRHVDEIKRWSRATLILRGIFGFATPAQPATFIGEENYKLSDEMQELMATMAPQEALSVFLSGRPEGAPWAAFRTEKESGAPMPATKETADFLDNYGEFMHEYRQAAPWLLPQSQDLDEFDRKAWNEMIAEGLRHRKDASEWYRDLKFAEGAEPYFKMKDDNAAAVMRAELAGNKEVASRLKKEWELVGPAYLKQHPLFASMLTGESRQKRDQVLREMDKMLTDPRLPEVAHSNQLRDMTQGYLAYDSFREQVKDVNTKAAKRLKNEMKIKFMNWGLSYVAEHPEMRTYWFTLVEPAADLRDLRTALEDATQEAA